MESFWIKTIPKKGKQDTMKKKYNLKDTMKKKIQIKTWSNEQVNYKQII